MTQAIHVCQHCITKPSLVLSQFMGILTLLAISCHCIDALPFLIESCRSELVHLLARGIVEFIRKSEEKRETILVEKEYVFK